MKKYLIILTLIGSLLGIHSQTVVKMNVPVQAKEQVKVVILFDEQVPEGMPVVLGLMGYNITGGIEPFSYQWVQNGNIVGTGDVVIVTPKKGDQFSLKATDKNKCYNTTVFNMKVISRVDGQSDEENGFKVYPTIITDDVIHIEIGKSDKIIHANIRIFDMKGDLMFQTFATENYIVNHYLANGIYFVSVKTNEYHTVTKVIVQH